LLVFVALPMTAALVNDGTSTVGLVRRAPEPLAGPAETTLGVGGQGALVAAIEEPNFFNLPALHTVWYAEAYVATGTVYKASAKVTVEGGLTDNSGTGVVGWLDEASGLGMLLGLKSAGGTHYVGVELLDFDTSERPQGYLYDTNGVEVHPFFSQAWKAVVSAGFRSTNATLLELTFSAPTTNDLAVLAKATARVSARALQDNGQGLQAVSAGLDFLTTLPGPASGERRFGYYAVYDPVRPRTGPIGALDDLAVEGEIGRGNQRPTVTLTSPADGAVVAPGSAVALVADAADPDPEGRVVRVDFYVDGELIGSASQSPLTVTWTAGGAGEYDLSAVAEDDRGATQTSEVVSILVKEVVTDPPTLTIVRDADTITLTWDRAGFQLQASTDLGSAWFDIATTGTQYTESVGAGLKLFRLVGSGAPAGPEVSISIAAGTLTVTWNRSGYQLQSAPEVEGLWTTVSTAGMQHSEPATEARKFFRLIQ